MLTVAKLDHRSFLKTRNLLTIMKYVIINNGFNIFRFLEFKNFLHKKSIVNTFFMITSGMIFNTFFHEKSLQMLGLSQ